MTHDEIKAAVLGALRRIAPEVDPATLRSGLPLRDQADLDSMDFLNFMLELHAALGIDVPEADYPQVATLDGCIAYIAAHAPQPQAVRPGDR
ncbi:MAG: acyl carrier protein [Gemmatimonas sp.]|nr:acyl carrier protein [Gemmatimonadaceae bacterium]